MTKKTITPQALGDDLNARRRVEQYDDRIIAWNLTGNALHLWAALAHCRAHGMPVPDDLVATFAEGAELLLKAARQPGAGAADFADALRLQRGARGMTAWERAEQQRRKVRKLRLMDALRRNHPQCGSAQQAAEAVAGDGFTAATLAKDFSNLMQGATGDWRDPNYNPFTAHLHTPPRTRRALPKKAALR